MQGEKAIGSIGSDMLNKGIDLGKLGFKLQDKKMYESLISPFAQDQEKPHPFKYFIPQSFEAPDMQFDKLDKSKLVEDTLIYIFYNIIDDKMQLMAAELLMAKNVHYHRKLRVWLKEMPEDNRQYSYFNIQTWRFTEFKGQVKQEDLCKLSEFQESVGK